MSLPRYPQVTQELLSAYLDDAISVEERELVERAIRNDANVAQQLESLRQTVHLLHTLPAVALPRSFTLDAVMIEAAAERTAKSAEPIQAWVATEKTNAAQRNVEPTWWQRFAATLSGFTPLRNAVAVVLLLAVALYAGNWSFLVSNTTVQPAGQQIASAPRAEIVRSTSAALAADSSDAETGLPASETQAKVAAEAVETVEAIETVETVSNAPIANAPTANATIADTEAMAQATTVATAADITIAGSTTADDGVGIQEEATLFAMEPTAPVAMRIQEDGAAAFSAESGRSGPAGNSPARPGDDTQVLNPGQPPAGGAVLQNPTVVGESSGTSAENTAVADEQTAEPDAVVVAAASTDVPESTAATDDPSAAQIEVSEAAVVATVAAEAIEEALPLAEAANEDGAENQIAESRSTVEGNGSIAAASLAANEAFSSTLATPLATADLLSTSDQQPLITPVFTLTVTPTSTITPTLTPTVTGSITAPLSASPVSTSPVATPTPTATPLALISESRVALMAVPVGALPTAILLMIPLYLYSALNKNRSFCWGRNSGSHCNRSIFWKREHNA